MRKEENIMTRCSINFIIAVAMCVLPASRVYSAEKELLVLTEEKALEMALDMNYDILSKAEELKQARARLRKAQSEVMPNVGFGGAYTRYEDHPFVDYKGNTGFTLSLDQVLFAGGAVVNSIKSAAKNLQATEFGKREFENQVIYDTKYAFYNVILAREFVKIREETLNLTEENLAITEARYKKGQASHYDVLRNQVEVANVKPEVIKVKNYVEVARNLLKVLLGIEPPRAIEVDGELKYLQQDINLRKEIGLALGRRPALREIELQEKAAHDMLNVARAGYYPQVGFNLTGFANEKETFTAGRGKYDEYWVGTIAVNVSLFDGFLTRAGVQEAQAAEKQVSILKEQLIDGVQIDVENAVLDLRAAREVVESQQENVARAEEAYEIIQKRYSLGQATQLDVLDARVALSQARVNYAQSLFDAIAARARLDYVTGKERHKGTKAQRRKGTKAQKEFIVNSPQSTEGKEEKRSP